MEVQHHTYTQTHLSCPVLSCPSTDQHGSRGIPKRKEQEQQEQATTLLGHTWFTGSGHGAAAWKSEDQCESSSGMHSSIIVATCSIAVSALGADGYL